MSKSSRERFTLLDGARGIAALLVLAFHASGGQIRVLSAVADFCVDFFFVLSGFVLLPAMSALKQEKAFGAIVTFAGKRALRLWPLLFLTMVAAAASEAAQWAASHFSGLALANPPFNHKTGIGWLLCLLMLQSVFQSAHEWLGPAWSLSVEWWTNLLSAVLTRANAYIYYGVPLGIGVLCTVYARPYEYGSPGHIWGNPDLWGLGRGLCGFFLGQLLRMCYDGRNWRVGSRFPVLLIPLLLATAGITTANFGYGHRLAYVGVPILASLTVLNLATEERRRVSVRLQQRLIFLGQISFGVYLWHSLVVNAVKAILNNAHLNSGVPLLVVTIGVSAALSIVLARISQLRLEPLVRVSLARALKLEGATSK